MIEDAEEISLLSL